MSLELFLTLRFFRSKKRNIFISVLTIISVVGVLIATASLITVNSVVRGFETEIREKILENEPHLMIYPKSDEISDERFYHLIDQIKGDPQITMITPYISSTVLISSFNNLNAVKLTGVDPNRAKDTYGIFRQLKSGKVSYMNDPDQAYTEWYHQHQKKLIQPQLQSIRNNQELDPDIKNGLMKQLQNKLIQE